MKRYRRAIVMWSVLILAVTVASFFASIFTGFSPYAMDPSGLVPPGPSHLCGTDFLGRDILSRTLSAAVVSIAIGVVSRAASVVMGLAVGIPAGLLSPRLAMALNMIIEVFLAIPSLLLAMALAVVLGERYLTIFVAIAVGSWAPVARFTSVQVRDIASKDFVTAERALGATQWRIVRKHILPSFMPTLIPVITTGIATAIMIESTLSFLGLGGGITAHDIPSWGKMINEGAKFIFDAPWMILPPAIMLMVTVFAFNRIGDILADK